MECPLQYEYCTAVYIVEGPGQNENCRAVFTVEVPVQHEYCTAVYIAEGPGQNE